MTKRTPQPGGRRENRQSDLLAQFSELALGRLEALDPLYDALAHEIHAIALWCTGSPADAADVVQDVFIRLVQMGGRLSKVNDPRAYVRRMAQRRAIDVHRQRRRRAEEPLDGPALLTTVSGSVECSVDALLVSRRLMELPPEQRVSIYLHVYAGCSFAEVARATGVPTFTAASRYRRGMDRLRRLMGAR